MCIIESKPDNIPADLRLGNPWPELQTLADSIDLDTCDDITHKHTPWGVPSDTKHSVLLSSAPCHCLLHFSQILVRHSFIQRPKS